MTPGVYFGLSRMLVVYSQVSIEETIQTTKHEGFHQYCHEYLDNIPSWFNEGLAEVFSGTELVVHKGKKTMRIRPIASRLKALVEYIEVRGEKHMPTVPKLMRMTQAEMYEPMMRSVHYHMAWAICYFCIQGKNKSYQSALKKYFKALTKGKNRKEAYESTFGRLDMRRFQMEWKEFLNETYKMDKGI